MTPNWKACAILRDEPNQGSLAMGLGKPTGGGFLKYLVNEYLIFSIRQPMNSQVIFLAEPGGVKSKYRKKPSLSGKDFKVGSGTRDYNSQ